MSQPTYPILLRWYDNLSVDTEEIRRIDGMTFPDDATMLALASYSKRHVEGPGWMLDSKARFREFTPVRRRREWAQPLMFLWRFVLVEYAITPPRTITVGELDSRLVGYVDLFAEAPIGADLRRHLADYRPEDPVTPELLAAWPM